MAKMTRPVKSITIVNEFRAARAKLAAAGYMDQKCENLGGYNPISHAKSRAKPGTVKCANLIRKVLAQMRKDGKIIDEINVGG